MPSAPSSLVETVASMREILATIYPSQEAELIMKETFFMPEISFQIPPSPPNINLWIANFPSNWAPIDIVNLFLGFDIRSIYLPKVGEMNLQRACVKVRHTPEIDTLLASRWSHIWFVGSPAPFILKKAIFTQSDRRKHSHNIRTIFETLRNWEPDFDNTLLSMATDKRGNRICLPQEGTSVVIDKDATKKAAGLYGSIGEPVPEMVIERLES